MLTYKAADYFGSSQQSSSTVDLIKMMWICVLLFVPRGLWQATGTRQSSLIWGLRWGLQPPVCCPRWSTHSTTLYRKPGPQVTVHWITQVQKHKLIDGALQACCMDTDSIHQVLEQSYRWWSEMKEVSKGHSPETIPWPSTADTQSCCSSVCWLVEGSVCTSIPRPARPARECPPPNTPHFSPESLLHTTPNTTSTGSAPSCNNITYLVH